MLYVIQPVILWTKRISHGWLCPVFRQLSLGHIQSSVSSFIFAFLLSSSFKFAISLKNWHTSTFWNRFVVSYSQRIETILVFIGPKINCLENNDIRYPESIRKFDMSRALSMSSKSQRKADIKWIMLLHSNLMGLNFRCILEAFHLGGINLIPWFLCMGDFLLFNSFHKMNYIGIDITFTVQ